MAIKLLLRFSFQFDYSQIYNSGVHVLFDKLPPAMSLTGSVALWVM